MNEHEESRDSAVVERENQSLRLRVAELQRRLARYSNPGSTERFASLDVGLSEREELLNETERIAHVGSWIWNLENNEVFWSEEMFRILGYDPEVDVSSTDAFFAAVHPDDRARVQERSARGVKSGVAEQIDFRVLRRDGSIRFVFMDGAMLFDDHGKLRRLVGSVLDVTEARKLHERLSQAEKMEAVGRLAGGIAHDFNNLLMVVRGNLDLLIGADQNEMRAVLDALESARSLTDALLAFGRKSYLQRRVTDINALLGTTLQLLRRVIGEQIMLSSELSAEPLYADIDPALFQQVLVNLAINARDALAQGGSIVVSTRKVAGPGHAWIELSVADDGPGMSESTKARLFEPFFTTKSHSKGTGLGLAMVHGTVAQHGGTIRVDSGEGRGTRFTIRIAATEAPVRVSSVPPAPPRESKKPANNITVLLIEDHAPVANTLGRMLRRGGCRVLLAARPSTALELFASHRQEIDVALCDLVMPEMPGTALVAELRRAAPKLPVVFMSGYRGESENLPASAKLLGKPFTMAQLMDAVQEAIAREQ